MRSRTLFTLLVVAGAVSLPAAAHAAGIPFFGPIIPPSAEYCPGSWALLLDVVNRTISFVITIAIVFVAPIMISYAGFLLVVNPVNGDKRSAARAMLLNTVVGIIIALAAWLIVNAVFAVLTPNGRPFGENWSALITSGGLDVCLKQAGALKNLNPAPPPNAQPVLAPTITGTAENGTPYLSFGNGPCAAANVKSAADAAKVSMSVSEANTLACLAAPESTCGTQASGARQADGTPVNAYGPWQIVISLKDACHSLTLSACGNLNCSAAFTTTVINGKTTKVVKSDPASQALAQKCVMAANSLTCAVSAAACLVSLHNGYTDWTSGGDGYSHATQNQCVAQYSK